MELKEVLGRVRSDQVGAGGQGLSELDCRRTDFLKRVCIIWNGWNSSAEASDAAHPADIRRGEWVSFDTMQRAVARQGPAPFEETPQMDDGGGQIFQPP